jgi:hypothetical protein
MSATTFWPKDRNRVVHGYKKCAGGAEMVVTGVIFRATTKMDEEETSARIDHTMHGAPTFLCELRRLLRFASGGFVKVV